MRTITPGFELAHREASHEAATHKPAPWDVTARRIIFAVLIVVAALLLVAGLLAGLASLT
jgi:hypothetical protein